jgi:hypothetical protein
MHPRMRTSGWLILLAASIIVGVVAAFWALFHIGPQLQCAADVECARAANRWWHGPALVAVALGPTIIMGFAWWRSSRRAA